MSASIVSLDILSYDLSMFPNIEKWMAHLGKSLDYFGEANKGLKEWKRALEQREKEIATGQISNNNTTTGLETLAEEVDEELSVTNE